MAYKVMNPTQKQSFDTMGTAGFVPYYRLEPDVVSGKTINGTVLYRSTADKGMQSYDYEFSTDGRIDGEYCIIASINEISKIVVTLKTVQTVTISYLKLAYVTIKNGNFTDFRLVGDEYLIKQISDTTIDIDDAISAHNKNGDSHKTIQHNLELFATEKDGEVLNSANAYADKQDVTKLNEAKAYADKQDVIMLNEAKAYADGKVADKTPYYQLEPGAIEGPTIDGKVRYKNPKTGNITEKTYEFSAANLRNGKEHCIYANSDKVNDNVVSIGWTNMVLHGLRLAYVMVENGAFSNFRLVGDKYLVDDIEFLQSHLSDKIPYCQIEPYVVEGKTISGIVHYKNSDDEVIHRISYSFNSDNWGVGDYVIVADANVIYSTDFKITLRKDTSIESTPKIPYTILAYVTIQDEGFTNFRLFGDKYLIKQISDTKNNAKTYTDGRIFDLDNKIDGVLEGAKAYAANKISDHNTADDAHSNLQSRLSSYTDNALVLHNTNTKAHENRFITLQNQIDEKVPALYVTGAISDHNTADDAHSNLQSRLSSYTDNALVLHNTADDAHGALFGTLRTRVDGLDGGLGAAAAKLNMLQKYPCYEYSTSGGNVQRFDDVSAVPHNIGITVHGATDSDGNSVTNPMVNVYGKNLLSTSGWEEKSQMAFDYQVIAGVTYTFSIYATYSSKTTGLYGFSLKIQESGTDIIAKGSVPINSRVSVTFTATESGTLYFNGFNTISCKEVQLEVGGKATEYEPYIEVQTANSSITIGEGEVFKIETFTAVSPNMTVIATDDNNLINTVDVTYNADLMKRIAKIEAAIAAQA